LIRTASTALGGSLMAVALAACTEMKPGGDRLASSAVLLDSGVDQGASICGHRAPPARPQVVEGDGNYDLVFAVSSGYYGVSVSSVDDAGRPAYLGLGFDLDDTCTGEGQGPSCFEPPWADASHTDGVEGIDNAAGQIVALESPLGPDDTPTTETMANQIIRVRGYSGGASDDQVDVAVYVGFGLAPREGGAVGLLWDGNDAWMILPDTLVPLPDGGTVTYSLDQPLYHDDHAYVSKGVLVARLPEARWPTGLAVAPSSVGRVEQVVLAGNLVRVGARWELQHMVTGLREPVSELLAIMGRLSPQGGQPICQSAAEYESAGRRLCTVVDIALGPDSPSTPCDALSGGSVLEAKQALLGGIGPAAESLPACAPGVHPETDSCDAIAAR
jgi:hypothetical protein